jgi:ribose 5-phosphate isomerase A
MTDPKRSKQTAGRKAVDFIESGMVIGLGTGSTVLYTLEELSRRLKEGALKDITCMASSMRTEQLAMQLGLPLTDFRQMTRIDITIDGADEVDEHLNLIKGGGGALLREKILAQNSTRFIVIVDQSKLSKFLGEKWSVPVEVLPFAWQAEATYIESIGGECRIRKSGGKELYRTDQYNYILDCHFGIIENPGAMADLLDRRAGIMGHGLFINLATDLIVGNNEDWKHMQSERM